MKNCILFFLLFTLNLHYGQNLVHNFEFNNNLGDSKPSGLSLVTSNTATANFSSNPNQWNWTATSNPGGGLVLLTNQLIDPQSYSLGFRISYNLTNPGYKKIVSFKGSTPDAGLYFHNKKLSLYPFGDGSIDYEPNTFYDFVLTRAATGEIKVYIVETNGTVTQVYNTTDTNSDSVPVLNGGFYEFRFFMDDTATNVEWTNGGAVRGIRVWDGPLSSSQIGAALSSVTTGDYSNLTSTSVTLNGEVNPQGTNSTFVFEYGTTTAYGNTIATSPSSSSVSSAISVSANIIGLSPGVTYHYRLKSTNVSGDSYGSDMTFTTNSPGGVPGSNLWLEANLGVTNSGTTLTGWTDQSATNSFTVVGTPGYKPDAINFNPAVTFNNNTPLTSLALNRLDGNTNITYVDGFSVFKHTDNNSNFIGSINPGANYGVAIFASSGLNSNYVGNGDENKYSSFTAAGLTNSYCLVNMDVSLIASPYVTGSYNGANQTFTNGSGADFSNIVFTPSIGGTNNNGTSYGWAHGQGELAEVILFPSSLSNTDKLKIKSYLAIKYGINLSPSVTNYVNSSGNAIWNSALYWNDVFGIGKDDTSQLNQPQSNSINTGSGDGTGQSGKGNLVLSSPSSLDNNDFLLIGHDNEALTETTSGLPVSEAGKTRLSRSWKVKRTGDVGTVNLSFDLTGLCLSGIVNTDYKILIDTDGNGDFTNGTVNGIVASSFSNNKLVFDNITLPDNAVFTFSGTAVASSLTSAVDTDNQTLCVSSQITDITYATIGATGIGTVAGLPSGVTASWSSNTITISGTPTSSGAFNYTIPLTGGCGTVNVTGTINVTPENTVSTASSSPAACVNSSMTTITHSTTGATGIGTVTGLPNGVSASWSSNTITISGTPTSSGTFNYSIPLTGGCGSVNASGTITVSGLSSITLSSSASTENQSVCQNNPVVDIVYDVTGATGATFSGLPAGVTGSYLAGVYTISGTPNVSGVFNYSITTSGGCLPNANAFGTITVFNSPTPTGSSTQTINEGVAADATIEDLVVTGNSITWYGSLADANVPTNALPAGTVLVDGNTYYAVNFENGCYSTPFAVTATVVLGISSYDKNELKVYPNPNEGTFYVDFNSVQNNLKIEVFNLIGQMIYVNDYKLVDKLEVNFSAPSGVYLVNIISEDKSKTFKIIKK